MPRIGTLRVLGLLALSCSASGATAQEPTPPCRQAELDHASFLLGTWRVTVRERTGSEPDAWRERAGTSVWEWRVAGCVLMEQLSLEGGPGTHSELRLLAYDGRAGEWNLAIVDSQHGNIVTMVGRSIPDGLQFTSAQTRRGQLLVDRVTFRRVQGGELELSIESSFDAGATWTTLVSARYSRRDPENR